MDTSGDPSPKSNKVENDDELFDDEILRDELDSGEIEKDSPWSLHTGVFRPKTKTLLAYSKMIAEDKESTAMQMRFLVPNAGPKSNLLIPQRNLKFFMQEAKKILTFSAKPTGDPSIVEVNFPFKIDCFNVMRKFFHCQKIKISELPHGFEFFAEAVGLELLYLASFIGRIRPCFGDLAGRTMDLGSVIKNFISYCGVLQHCVPGIFLEYFARTFAMEFDEQRFYIEQAMSHDGQRFFLFLMEHGALYSFIQVVSILGSRDLAVYVLERVFAYRCLFQDQQIIDMLAMFDWRDRLLHQFISELRDVDGRFWRCMAQTKANFCVTEHPAHIFRFTLPQGLRGLLDTSGVTPNFSFQRPFAHGMPNPRRITYVGHRIHQETLFSVYLLRANQLRILVLFVRHDLRQLHGWSTTNNARPWPEVTFAKQNCSCLKDSSWTGSVPLLGKEDLLAPVFAEIRTTEGFPGDTFLLMSEKLVQSWIETHTPRCTLHLRVRFISDLELVQRDSFRLILKYY